MSEPEPSNYFKPVEKYALIVCNSRYEELRAKEHFAGFCDLEEVKQDLVSVKTGLRKFGFGALEIHAEENVDHDTIKSLLNGYRVKLLTNSER